MIGCRSGRPVNNVHIQVVDEYLAPVPLGAPGEIVFSGVCVGPRIHQRSGTHPGGVPDRSGRPGVGIAAVIMAGGGRTASWSFWAAGTPS